MIGKNSGTGTINVDDGTFLIRGPGANLTAGKNGGEGIINVANAGQFIIDSTATGFLPARLVIGTENGTGSLNASGAGTQVTVQSSEEDGGPAQLDIGSDGSESSGEAIVSDGAALDLISAANNASLQIGVQGGTGRLELDDARMTLDAVFNASIRIGGLSWPHQEGESGNGKLLLQNGAQLTATGGSSLQAPIFIESGEGGENALLMRSGATVDLGVLGTVNIGQGSPDRSVGGTATLDMAGDGTRMEGLNSLWVSADMGRAEVYLSDGAQMAIGGAEALREARVTLGAEGGSSGSLFIDRATLTVRASDDGDAGSGADAAQSSIGRQGGEGLLQITGDALANPRTPVTDPGGAGVHGFAQIGGIASRFSEVNIGWGAPDARGEGTVLMSGGSFGLRYATLGPDAEVNAVAEGVSTIRLGHENGTGRLEADGGAHVYGMADDAYSGLEVGLGQSAGGTPNEGTFLLTGGSRLDLTSAGFDAWTLVGHEGGTGDMRIADSHAHIAGARSAGFRIGSHWFDRDNDLESGVGSLMLSDGATARVEAGGEAWLWVGGGRDGQATADIVGGSVMELDGEARGAVMVGGMAGFLPGTGGEGELSVSGAGSALRGVQDMLVGFNSSTGAAEITDGGQIDVIAPANRAGGEAFVGVGIGRAVGNDPVTGGDGSLVVAGAESLMQIAGPSLAALHIGELGSGSVSVADGGRISVRDTGGEDGSARLVLGTSGGDGHLSVDGADSAVSVTGATSGIFMGVSGSVPEGGVKAG